MVRELNFKFERFSFMKVITHVTAGLWENTGGPAESVPKLLKEISKLNLTICTPENLSLPRNLIKNAIESVETAINHGLISSKVEGLIKVEITKTESTITIKIIDNGIGLPKKKNQLFEPYVTSRENGIGLGLAIVKKIIEEHDGYLTLLDAENFHSFEHKGAIAQVSLPILTEQDGQIQLL